MPELSKAYEPKKYEDAIYKRWEEAGLFAPEASAPADAQDYFSIVLPPPNVTGTLHMGHAAMLAIEDVMVRYHRMKGDRTLWVPGTDHAAIATQSKVEKLIFEEQKKTKYDLGREAFLERVRKFAQESHDTIVDQCRKMGASLDWNREAYTLDAVRSQAVRLVFKQMYDDGLIYQGHRIVNWDPKGQTTVSDDEIVYKEEKTTFYYFQYGPFVIGTARPETKFGDKYVVVHPDDERYSAFHDGQKIELEWINGPITAIVVKDAAIDMKFGTGAMTITPWHSVIDFEIAECHGLDKEQIIDEQGKLLPIAGEFAGMPIASAREQIVEKLRSKGLVVKEEEYVHQVATAERSGGLIEPQIKKQWFVAVTKEFIARTGKFAGRTVTLKQLMQEVVRDGSINIIPDRFEKTYFSWIDNLRDWCISRQIWFGHQIPVWYKTIPALSDLSELKKTRTEKQPGADSPVADNKGPEYRFVLTPDDRSWVEQHITWTGENRYADFFDGTCRTRVDKDAFVVTSKPTKETGVVAKHSKKGVYHDHAVFVEERATAGFCRYEIEFKDILPDHFKGRETVSSTDILRYQNHDRPDMSLYVGTSSPWFGEGWTQDSDTLDTWFSSGLWTFSTLLDKKTRDGESLADWIARSADMKNFHPTSVLETGYDIIFFWVARMILMTTYALGDVPFKTVYLHGLVRDEKGRKMSKSLGNIINPLDMIEQYGTDATRLSLLLGSTPGNDMKLSEEKVAGFRNFTNKLWNIARFMLLQIPENTPVVRTWPQPKTVADEYILSRFNSVVSSVTRDLSSFQFSAAGETLREFTWDALADWYLEVAKIEGDKEEILSFILENLLKLWHPFMPFVTEALWREWEKNDSLIAARWPTAVHAVSYDGQAFDRIKTIVAGIRFKRAENKVEPSRKINVSIIIAAGDAENLALIVKNQAVISGLRTGIDKLAIVHEKQNSSAAVSFVESGMEIILDLAGAVDLEKEKVRIAKERSDVERYVTGLAQKLGNEQFVKNAPEAVVALERKKLTDAEEKLRALQEQAKTLGM